MCDTVCVTLCVTLCVCVCVRVCMCVVVGTLIVGYIPHNHECKGILSHERGNSEDGIRSLCVCVCVRGVSVWPFGGRPICQPTPFSVYKCMGCAESEQGAEMSSAVRSPISQPSSGQGTDGAGLCGWFADALHRDKSLRLSCTWEESCAFGD